jgi:hypothetical protein
MAVLAVLLVLDCRQTLRIKDHPDIWETNPILGKHPSDSRIKIYFAICVIGLPLAGFFISGINHIFGFAWLLIWAAIEVKMILSNYKLGLGFP